MGLDMYLRKGKRIPKKSVREINEIEDELYDGSNKELLEKYKDFIHEKKYEWLETPRYSLTEEIGYWRKANAIHNWFVKNCQNGVDDCGLYEVTKEQLEELLDRCIEVIKNSRLIKAKVKNGYTLKKDENGVIKEEPNMQDGLTIENPRKAHELLPSADGFFFGSTEYDEWYIEGIAKTVEIIIKVLTETDFNEEYVAYTSSW